jgi:ketosteroid isomerase-like protein
MKYLLFLLLLVSSSVTFSQVLKGPESEIKIILNSIKQFSTFVMNQQPEKIALAYTEDAKLFPMGTDIMVGRNAIQKYWTSNGPNKTSYHKITPQEIEVIGDTAYDYGYYEGKTLKVDGAESAWKGKYVIVWKKVNDQWLIHLDCWNPIN